VANITSKISVTSEIEGLEDVKFVIYRMTEARRTELRRSLSEVNGEANTLTKELASLDMEKDAVRIGEITTRMDELFSEIIDPTWVAWGLDSIENLSVDGQPITKERVKHAPSTLYREILDRIRKEAGMTGDEVKNSPLPIISGEVATVTQ